MACLAWGPLTLMGDDVLAHVSTRKQEESLLVGSAGGANA
jgi:hypothetical protein